MIKKVSAILMVILIIFPVSAQLRGKVYYDKNENSIFDNGDKLAVGIKVSDGKNVVTTDKNGNYALDGHDKQKFIFITTPSNYNVSDKHYIAINNNISSDYDFGLVNTELNLAKDGAHCFIQITDTEISTKDGHQKWVSNVKNYAKDNDASFIIHTGDICYEAGLNAHIELMNDANMGVPVRYCVGNHDYVKGAYGEELFEAKYGPIYYSFEVGKTHYIVTPMPYGDYKPGFSQDLFMEWLKNDLSYIEKGMSIVVFNHDLLSRNGDFILGTDNNAIDLKKFNLKGWVYGHWHINHVLSYDGIQAICTSADKGGIDHSAAAFRKINIAKDGSVSSKLIYPYVDSTLTIAQINENNGAIAVSVNCYNSDSEVVKVNANYTFKGKQYNNNLSKVSDWNWRGSVPQNAVIKSITAFFNNGKTQTINYKDEPKKHLKMVWNSNAGSNVYMSSPIISGNNIYVGYVDESLSGKAGVACFDTVSGKKLWFYNTRNSIKNSLATANETIFAQDAQGYLYAIDAQNGVLLWEHKLSVSEALPAIVEGLATYNGKIYAGTGKGLTALDYAGNVIWKNNQWAQNEGTTSNFTFTDNLIITGSQWQALFANDLKTGNLVWKADKDGLRFRASTPILKNGVLYVLSQSSLFILDPKSGNVIVRKELCYDVQVSSTPLFTDDAIIFGTTNSGIRALDIRTLEPLWDVQTAASLIYTSPYQRFPAQNIESSPILTNCGKILIGCADGYVRLINPKDGNVLDTYNIGAPIISSFTSDLTSYYVADYGGNVYKFIISK